MKVQVPDLQTNHGDLTKLRYFQDKSYRSGHGYGIVILSSVNSWTKLYYLLLRMEHTYTFLHRHGACPTDSISIKFWSALVWYILNQSQQNLDMSRHNCRDRHKIFLWSAEMLWTKYYKVSLNFEFDQNIVSGTGAMSCILVRYSLAFLSTAKLWSYDIKIIPPPRKSALSANEDIWRCI